MATMSESQYAQVLFNMGKEVFPTNVDLECEVEVTKSLVPSKWDWVGLFKVGFTRVNDYITYQYFPKPASYKEGQKVKVKMVWSASYLPKDDIDFYQLAYMSYSKGTICGASNPFQFHKSAVTEFVEEEEDDMTVVRPRFEVMQEEIADLKHKTVLLTQQCQAYKEEIEKRQEKIKIQEDVITALERNVRMQLDDLSKAELKNANLEEQLGQMVENLNSLKEEKQHMEAGMLQLQNQLKVVLTQMDEAKSLIRTLEAERDELNGLKQNQQDEVNAYKNEVIESQIKLTHSSKTVASLSEQLESIRTQNAKLHKECEEMKQIEAKHKQFIRQLELTGEEMRGERVKTEKEQNILNQELQNANDKLLACDTMKSKLMSELEAYAQTHKKMSQKCEMQEMQIRDLMEKCALLMDENGQLKVKLLEVQTQQTEMENDLRHAMGTKAKLEEAQNDLKVLQAVQAEVDNQLKKAEEGLKETVANLKLTSAQLRVVSDEKRALQVQVKEFEDELMQSLSTKDEEVKGITAQLEEKGHLVEEKEEELAAQHQKILDQQKQIIELTGQVEEHTKQAMEYSEKLAAVESQLDKVNEAYETHKHQMESVAQERDLHAKKCLETEEALKKLEVEKCSASQKAEGTRFSLKKENEALKLRLSDMEADVMEVKKEKEELEEKLKNCQEELTAHERNIQDLTKRLHIGKMEYTNLATANERLKSELKTFYKDSVQTTSMKTRPVDSTSSCTSDSEGEGGKVFCSQLKTERKKRHFLKAMLKEKEEEINTLRSVISSSEGTIQEKDAKIECLKNTLTCMQEGLCRGNKELTPCECHVFKVARVPESEVTGNSILEAPAREERRLPVPLEPTVVLPTEESRAYCEPTLEETNQDVFEDCPQVAVEDSFMDAIGEEMKICPICERSDFAPDDFDEHMTTHFERICPVCRNQADDTMSPQDFEKHVNRCLDADSTNSS